MTPRRVLVLGSGGREHALAWRLAAAAAPPEVIVAPGNPGLATRFPCVPLDPADAGAVIRLAREREVDLVVVGPEGPLAAGIVDALAAASIAAFGPTREAARLESSKWFAKTVMTEAGVPTARALRCTDARGAARALHTFGAPWVLKADGLAAGKGVLVTAARDEAIAFLAGCFDGRAFGASGAVVVIEEHLVGAEASVMAVTDGERFVLLPAARDFKRAFEGDRGPNTGGMGAWAPHPEVGADLEREVGERIVAPVLARMRERGTPFRGVLYAGLMLTATGPRVIEFNARFGDPETQVVMPLVEGSLAGLLASAARGSLAADAIRRVPGAAAAIALTDAAYPGPASGAGWIEGLEACEDRDGLQVFHAATAPAGGGWAVTGGRAAYVMATGESLAVAARRAGDAVGALGGRGWRWRSDVAIAPAAPGETGAGGTANHGGGPPGRATETVTNGG